MNQTKSALPAAAMVFFTACAQMPPGASELTEEQSIQAEDLIEQSETLTPMVVDLLGVTSPLFDLQGNPTDDNSALREGVRIVMDEVEVIWEAKRVVTMPEGEFPQSEFVQAAAYGLSTETELDDYIVLSVSEDGQIINSPSDLMHEGVHYFFGLHESALKDFLKEKGDSMSAAELLELYIAENDVSYTVGSLYDVFYNLPFYSRKFIEAEEDVRNHAQDAVYTEGPTAQNNRDVYYDKLVRWQTREGWANDLVDRGFYESAQGQLDVFGVTYDEFLQVIMEQDALFEVHREAAERALEAFQEIYPEYKQEIVPERNMETRSRLNKPL